MNKYTFVLIFILFFICKNLFAQETNILVLVSSQKMPLEFVNVYLPKQEIGAVTDVKIGKTRLEVSMIGYKKYSQEVEINKKNQIFLVELETDENQLDEVVITGTMREVRKAESIVPVEIYSAKFFERNPTPSLFEAMQNVNGVRPQMQCNVCNTGDIHINGMEGPYTMVLIDGMPIVSGLSTVYGLNGIPSSIIQRVEIVKGPAAALYGSEAMGGIINVITKNPDRVPKLSVDMNATSYQEFNTDLSAGFKINKKVRALLGINYFHFDKKHDINHDNFTDVTLSKRLSIFNKWSFERKDKRIADVAFRYVLENRHGGEMQWEEQFRGTDSIYGESIYTNRYEILANYQLPINNERVMFNFSANSHVQDSFYGTTKYFADQKIVFAQMTWDKKISTNNNLLLGIGNRYTFYDDNTPITAELDSAKNVINKAQIKTLTGGFFQNEYAVDKFKILLGLRYDYSNVHKHIFSPRLGLKYNFTASNSLRLNAGNGFRVVNVFSEDHAALTGGRNVIFLSNLQPEKSWNMNLNYTAMFSLPKGFLDLDISVFYTYYNNKIVADYLTDSNSIIYNNLTGFADNYGLSINTDWTFDNGIKAIIGGTFLQSYIHKDGQKIEQIQTPKFTANYSISYTFARPNLTLDFTGYVYSSMLLPTLTNDYRPSRSPFFNISNIQITKKWKNGFELYAGIKNLFNFYPKEDVIMRAFDPFDKKANDTESNPKGYTFDPSYNYAPMQTARFLLGFRVRIN
ncbi:MAG: TonB-dependent receptor [Bacteroidetes bacterium]|nr:MAG: TonB-dependent receptor [Bacteroidota bacterium]